MLTRSAWLVEAAQANGSAGPNAVLVLRLRDFDALRIEFGYDVGEALLQSAEHVLAALLRPDDRVCKLGEAAFALLLPALRSENHALLAANRLARAFAEEISAEGRVIHAAVAMGLSFSDGSDSEPLTWLRQADIASLEALQMQHSLVRFAPERFHGEVPKEELREAILRNQLEVWLQPLWTIREPRIVGAESLARWQLRSRGWVSPSQFVPCAERVGLIGEFTRWSLNTTLRHAAAARQVAPALQIAFNVSPRIFVEDDLVEQVLDALRLWDVPPTALKLEVTEGAIMHDPLRSAHFLNRFHAHGIGIAIDDFGTGYSSFTYLQQFPATELKIDQSFVRRLAVDARSRQLVRSMIELAHNLDLRVVAEGAEDQATLDVLGELDCDLVQGFLLGEPQPAEAFIAGLKNPIKPPMR